MKILNPNHFGTLSVTKLEAFEQEIGARLPENYRSFLLENNGGKAQDAVFMAPDDPFEEDSEWIERPFVGFYGLHEQNVKITADSMEAFKLNDAWRDLQKQSEAKEWLPIGQDIAGNYVCLNLNGERFGEIGLFDHEYEVMTTLAEDFQSFLVLLADRSNEQSG